MTIATFAFVSVNTVLPAALSCSLPLAAVDVPAFGGISLTCDMTLLSSVLVLWREDIVSEGGCELVVVADDSALCTPIEESSFCCVCTCVLYFVVLTIPVGSLAIGTGLTSSVVESVTIECELWPSSSRKTSDMTLIPSEEITLESFASSLRAFSPSPATNAPSLPSE